MYLKGGVPEMRQCMATVLSAAKKFSQRPFDELLWHEIGGLGITKEADVWQA